MTTCTSFDSMLAALLMCETVKPSAPRNIWSIQGAKFMASKQQATHSSTCLQISLYKIDRKYIIEQEFESSTLS